MASWSILYILFIVFIVCNHASSGCDFFYAGPSQLTLDNVIGNIIIRKIVSISFDLQLHETCSSGNCHLLRIHNSGPIRVPLITIPSSFNGIRSIFSDSNGQQTKIDYSDPYLKTTFVDGNWHKFYFKWSDTERLFLFDDIVYGNITNGIYDSSQYFDQQFGIWIIDTTPVRVLDGSIANICINSSHDPPTQNPTTNPTLNPSFSPTTFAPSMNPTSSPIDCVSRRDESLSVSNLSEWKTHTTPSSAVASTFATFTGANECYLNNPCISIEGIAGTSVTDDVFIEKSFDVSAFTNIKIGLELATDSLDIVAEYAFFETVCDGLDPKRIKFHEGVTEFKRYSGCFDFVVESCDLFTLRIGGHLGGGQDKIYVNEVVMQYSTFAPTNDPTMMPTSDPTINPTMMPTLIPTTAPSMLPTQYPSSNPSMTPSASSLAPTKYPTKDPTVDPTIDPTLHPTKDPTLPFGQVMDPDNMKTTFNGIQNGGMNVSADDSSLYFILGGIVMVLVTCIVTFSVLHVLHGRKVKENEKELNQLREKVRRLSNSPTSGQRSPSTVVVNPAVEVPAMIEAYSNAICSTPPPVNLAMIQISTTQIGHEVAGFYDHRSMTPMTPVNVHGVESDLPIDTDGTEDEGLNDDDDPEDDELYAMDGQVSPTGGDVIMEDGDILDEDENSDGMKLEIVIDEDGNKEDVLKGNVTPYEEV